MHHVDKKEYDRLADLESKHWENFTFDSGKIFQGEDMFLQGANHPVVKLYSNISQTGDVKKDWLIFLIEHFRQFRRGCSIGCGSGWVEKILVEGNIVETMDCHDISEGAIEEAKRANKYPERLHFTTQDCNKIRLDRAKYDFILFHHSLHHLLELEYIMDTVEAALSEDGIIVLVDYIGETRWQWEPTKIKICKLLLDFMPHDVAREVAVFDKEFFQENPFESIRSAEILPLMNSRFQPLWQQNIGGILYPLNNMIVSTIPQRQYNRLIFYICLLDALCSNQMMPCFTFSIFVSRKSSIKIDAEPISLEQILNSLMELTPHEQYNEGPKYELKMDSSAKGSDSIFARSLGYLHTHGLKKTLARSFLEISRKIDESTAYLSSSQSGPRVINEPSSVDLSFTGERVVPTCRNDCFYAHLSLYNFAKDFIPDKVVADAGCGAGYGTYYLATLGPKAVYGIDVDEAAIQFAKEHYRAPNLTYVQMNCEKIDFREKSFDVVFSSNMIEHLDNYRVFLKGVTDVLKDNGVFILATPPLYGAEPVEDNPFHHTNLRVGEWIDILAGYYKNIETYCHLFRTDRKNSSGELYALDFANKPEDCLIDETDFYFEKVPLSLYREKIETLTALFVLSAKK